MKWQNLKLEASSWPCAAVGNEAKGVSALEVGGDPSICHSASDDPSPGGMQNPTDSYGCSFALLPSGAF